MLLAPEIDSGHVSSKDGQTLELLSAAFRGLHSMPFSHPDYLSEHARPGWPFVDSDLGESYESLANVQSPSWNHADLCGIRTNGYRVLAAVVLPRTIPLTLLKVTDYSIRFKPVAKLTSGPRRRESRICTPEPL